MTTEMITLKLDEKFLEDVDKAVKKEGFHSRTEFIRHALREKVEEAKLKEAMLKIAHLKGASRRKTSDEELDKIREMVFEEFGKKVK